MINLVVEVTDLDLPMPTVEPADFMLHRDPVTMKLKLSGFGEQVVDGSAIDPADIAMQIGNAVLEAIREKQAETKVMDKDEDDGEA
jgi:hypothetical protein